MSAEDLGIQNGYERKIQKEINQAYLDAALPGTLSGRKYLNQIVNHGPESRNPHVTPPDYPWVDSSGREITRGPEDDPHRNLREALESLEKEGLEFALPKEWEEVIWPPSHPRSPRKFNAPH